MKKQLIIIGGGPAGLAAAISAYENGIPSDEILIIERDRELGGILNQCIHSGFGLHYFGEELTGPEYSGKFIDRINEIGIGYVTDSMVLSIDDSRHITFVSPKLGFIRATAEAIILAMGCRERTRGALNIAGSRPAGIYSAGTAQRYVNIEGYMPGKKTVILGSGDIGLIMARRLTLEGTTVLRVCELMPYSGGLARNISQCLDDFDIPLYLSHTVTEIKGKDRVEGVVISAVDENLRPIPGSEEYVECDTLLLSVGLIPENELTCGANIAMDKITGGAVVNQYCETSCTGIFACGNVLHVHDLVDFVSREASNAGKSAAKFIKGYIDCPEYISVQSTDHVKYVVPQKISKTENTESLKFFFRVDNNYRNVTITLSADEQILYSKKKTIVSPGEMESIEIDEKKSLSLMNASKIIISIVEAEKKE